jgi:hypothetical protein
LRGGEQRTMRRTPLSGPPRWRPTPTKDPAVLGLTREADVSICPAGLANAREGVSLVCAGASGSDREMNFGVTGEAAPNAASSSVARYSCAARVAVSLISSGFHSRLEPIAACWRRPQSQTGKYQARPTIQTRPALCVPFKRKGRAKRPAPALRAKNEAAAASPDGPVRGPGSAAPRLGGARLPSSAIACEGETRKSRDHHDPC